MEGLFGQGQGQVQVCVHVCVRVCVCALMAAHQYHQSEAKSCAVLYFIAVSTDNICHTIIVDLKLSWGH